MHEQSGSMASPAPFGELLKRHRRFRGLTQEELAERSTLSVRAISDLERGLKYRPRKDTVQLLADAFELRGADRTDFVAAARSVGQSRGREGPEGEPATRVRTFLIADVRGYTRMTVEQGDAAAARLARRFAELTREVVGAHDGSVLELRGDEVLSVFDSSRRALQAAVALQERFAGEPDDDLPLRTGIGLDAGEAIPVEGGYRGSALNLAARLCSLAGP